MTVPIVCFCDEHFRSLTWILVSTLSFLWLLSPSLTSGIPLPVKVRSQSQAVIEYLGKRPVTSNVVGNVTGIVPSFEQIHRIFFDNMIRAVNDVIGPYELLTDVSKAYQSLKSIAVLIGTLLNQRSYNFGVYSSRQFTWYGYDLYCGVESFCAWSDCLSI